MLGANTYADNHRRDRSFLFDTDDLRFRQATIFSEALDRHPDQRFGAIAGSSPHFPESPIICPEPEPEPEPELELEL